jgi:hypothetical protein
MLCVVASVWIVYLGSHCYTNAIRALYHYDAHSQRITRFEAFDLNYANKLYCSELL